MNYIPFLVTLNATAGLETTSNIPNKIVKLIYIQNYESFEIFFHPITFYAFLIHD